MKQLQFVDCLHKTYLHHGVSGHFVRHALFYSLQLRQTTLHHVASVERIHGGKSHLRPPHLKTRNQVIVGILPLVTQLYLVTFHVQFPQVDRNVVSAQNEVALWLCGVVE